MTSSGIAEVLKAGAPTTWKDRVEGRERGGFMMEGIHVCLWPIHTDVWQKPSQYLK